MIIRNIYIVDPKSRTEGVRDIEIQGEKIIRISNPMERNYDDMEVVIDGTGLTAMPGLVDVHVHFRDPGFEYKEDIYSGAKAAAKGGFTSVVMMANTKPAIDNPETLKYVLEKGKETDIRIYSCADITIGLEGRQITDMEVLGELGAVGFTDDGIPIKDPAIVREAMEAAARLDVPLSFHEEDPQYISENGINAGEASEYYGLKGSPRKAEISLIERDAIIARDIPAEIVIQHISSAEGVEIIRKERKTNKHIHAEVTPHHFSLTEQSVIKKGTLAKMNPPLRTMDDKKALIEGLIDGTIEIISTDHAPHSIEEKERPITQAPSGIIGLETSLALGIRELVKTGYLSLMELADKMSANPAMLYKLDAGYLAEGGPADIVIFDPNEEWTVPGEFASKSVNTPFIGEVMPGKIHMTICKGKIVYEM